MQLAGAVERYPHDPRLLGQRLKDRLADPPDRIGDEVDPLALVELVGRADEPEVPLVDQVGEGDTLVLVLLGDGDDEAEVAADEGVEGVLIAAANALRKRDFIRLGDQGIPADVAQVDVQRALVGPTAPASVADSQWPHDTHLGHCRNAGNFGVEMGVGRSLPRPGIRRKRQGNR